MQSESTIKLLLYPIFLSSFYTLSLNQTLWVTSPHSILQLTLVQPFFFLSFFSPSCTPRTHPARAQTPTNTLQQQQQQHHKVCMCSFEALSSSLCTHFPLSLLCVSRFNNLQKKLKLWWVDLHHYQKNPSMKKTKATTIVTQRNAFSHGGTGIGSRLIFPLPSTKSPTSRSSLVSWVALYFLCLSTPFYPSMRQALFFSFSLFFLSKF